MKKTLLGLSTLALLFAVGCASTEMNSTDTTLTNSESSEVSNSESGLTPAESTLSSPGQAAPQPAPVEKSFVSHKVVKKHVKRAKKHSKRKHKKSKHHAKSVQPQEPVISQTN